MPDEIPQTTTPPATVQTPTIEEMHPPITATETPPAANPPSGNPPEKKVLYKSGNLEITDPEELARYTQNLEEERVRARLQEQVRQGTTPATTTTVNPPPAKKSLDAEVNELMFIDTEKAVSRLRQGLKEEMIEEQKQRDRQIAFWNEFYEKNPDLKDKKRIVDLIVMERSAQLRTMSPADAAKFLEKETREIATMATRRPGEKVETLHPGGAVIPISGGSHQPAPSTTPQAPQTFVEQMKNLRKRRK